MKPVPLPLEKIIADPKAQPRVKLDQFLVDEYADAMRRGEEFPPLVTFFDGEHYWLADGFHRHAAALEAGKASLQVDVRAGGLRDAILHSCGANSGHGLRRTNADKRRAVLTLLEDEEWGRWSDSRIAKEAAVSDRFVARVRLELSPNRSEIASERQVERGGQTYSMRTARIGSAKKIAREARDLLRDTPIADDPHQVARLGERPPDVQVAVAERIAGGEARTVHEALRSLKYDEKLKVTLEECIHGRYSVVYADPPWRFDSGDGIQGSAAEHYPTLPTEEICALAVGSRTTEDAVLFLWSTNAHLPDALRVLEAWGFSYKSNLTWVKDTLGVGYYFRGQHELLLLGVKGSLLPREAVPSVLHAAPRGHSTKPDAVYDLVERMYPGMPGYLELFARRKPTRTSWVAWGNEPALEGAIAVKEARP